MIRRFFRDSSIYLIPNLISRGLSFLLVPFYTRILTPADYGAMDLITMFGVLVGLVIPLEISQGAARFFADAEIAGPKVRYSATAWFFTLLAYAGFLLLAIPLSGYLVAVVVGDRKYESIFRMSLFFFFFNGLFYLLQNQLRWEFRSKEYALLSIFFTSSNVFCAVFFALYLQMELKGIVLAQIVSGAASCFLGWYLLRKSFRFSLNYNALLEMLKFSLPLVPSSIAVFVFTYFNRLMISELLGIEEVGLFGIANRLCIIITVAISGFQIALTPLVYTYYNQPNTPQKLSDIFRYFVSFSLLMVLALSLYSEELIRILTTPDYYEASKLVPCLAPGVLLLSMYIFAPGIGIRKKTYLFLFINLFGGVLNIILNYFLIPLFGLPGAATATLITGLCLFTCHMSFSQRFYPVPHEWKKASIALFFAVVLCYLGLMVPLDFISRLLFKMLLIGGMVGVLAYCGMIKQKEFDEFLHVLYPSLKSYRNRA